VQNLTLRRGALLGRRKAQVKRFLTFSPLTIAGLEIREMAPTSGPGQFMQAQKARGDES
jgi:hypothetical protein